MKSTNTTNTTITYASYRIETYKTGEGRRRYTYDGRTDEGLAKARELANKKFQDGCKVTLYKLEKAVAADGTYEWIRTDIKEADGRAPKEQPKKNKKSAKKPVRRAAAPVAAADTSEYVTRDEFNQLSENLDKLAKAFAALAKSVSKPNKK